MTLFACAKVSGLLERRAVGLTESEGLLVESHLSECAGCREQSKVLEAARRLAAASGDAVLAPLARELLLKRAFQAAAETSVLRRPRAAPSWARLALACAALAVSAALVLLVVRNRASTSVAKGDQIEAGRLSSAGQWLATGARIPVDVPLSSEQSARLHLANAEVELPAGTRFVWRAEHDTLALEDGAVDVQVEHQAGRRFLVTTADFVVEVVGTQFRVDRQSVRVKHGTVRVLSRDGHDVLAVLPAGGVWSAPSAKNTDAEPAPVAVIKKAEALLDADEADKGHSATLEPVAQRLASARRALADGNVGEAEKLVESALGSRASPREVAEGRTLLAECAVARGQTERAAQLYLSVAKAFPALAAGENALFAGARLSERTGPAERARALFEDYLHRYPKGRFRLEAERHLQRNSTPR